MFCKVKLILKIKYNGWNVVLPFTCFLGHYQSCFLIVN